MGSGIQACFLALAWSSLGRFLPFSGEFPSSTTQVRTAGPLQHPPATPTSPPHPVSLESSLFPPRAGGATGEHDHSPLMWEPFLSVAHLKLHLPSQVSTIWSCLVHFTILPSRAALGKVRQRRIHSPLFQARQLLHFGQVAFSPGLFPGL